MIALAGCTSVLGDFQRGSAILPGDAAFDDGGPGASADASTSGGLDAALAEASAPEAGLNLPEGGVTVNQAQCGGACNGQRACSVTQACH